MAKPARKDLGATALIRPVPSAPPSQRPQAPALSLGERPEPAARAESWQACAVCQTRNQVGHRFCVACGSPLSAEPPPQAATPPPPSVVAPPATTPLPQPQPAPRAVAEAIPKPTPVREAPRPIAAAAPGGPAPVPTRTVALSSEAARPEVQPAPVVNLAEPQRAQPRAVACPRCQTQSELGVPYCRVCGQALAPPGKAAEEALAPPVPSVELPRPAVPTRPVGSPDPSARTDHYAPLGALKTFGRVVLLSKDGSDGATFPLTSEQVDIGGKEGAIVLNDDPYLSNRHARLTREGGQWYVVDLESVNGVYMKVRGRRPLTDGDLILLGQQVLRFEVVMDAEQALRPAMQHGIALFGTPQAPRYARLSQRTVEGVTRDVFHLYRAETSLGRETADIVFSDDPFLSRRHAIVRQQTAGAAGGAMQRSFTVEDAGSSNGTFAAIRGREQLTGGEVLRVGLHLFRVELSDSERGVRS